MDPRVIAEVVSNCVLLGAAVWIGVVGAASLAGIAVWWDAVRQGAYGSSSQTLTASAASHGVVDKIANSLRRSPTYR